MTKKGNRPPPAGAPLLGAHVSIAGGFHRALHRGRDLGCATIQIFTRNAVRWQTREIRKAEIATFREARSETGIAPVIAHDAYLINPASPDRGILERSRAALIEEIERASLLSLPYLVVHPGSHRGAGEETGLKRLADSLNHVCDKVGECGIEILIETSAGQGNVLGYRFEQLKTVIDRLKHPSRFGVCFDTCHVFSAGYDLRTEDSYARTMSEFDHIVGLDLIRVIHLNDSLGDLGERLDRHTHIGEGRIGTTGFRLLIQDGRFHRVPKIIETPKEDAGGDLDKRNLKLLRSYATR